jgi:hypothetical protein
MSDLAKWRVHGPVRSVKTSFAEWDLAQEQWSAHGYTEAIFRLDGKLEDVRCFNPDGSTAQYTTYLYNQAGLLIETQFWMGDSLQNQTFLSYDDAGRHVETVSLKLGGKRQVAETSTYDGQGRKTTVQFLHHPEGGATCTVPSPSGGGCPISYWIEAAEQGISAPGATTMTTIHAASQLPVEVLFHDAQNTLVARVVLARDDVGRLVKTEFGFGDRSPFSEAVAQGASIGVPMAEILGKVLGPARTVSTTTYAYDEHGLRVERAIRMGLLSEQRTTFRYDDHRNPIEESTVHEGREYGADEQGELHVTKERSHSQHTRFEYRYDEQANWTERVVWSRLEPNPNFERRNAERREINYHAGAEG